MNEFIMEELSQYRFPLSKESQAKLSDRYNLDDIDLGTVSKQELYKILWPDD